MLCHLLTKLELTASASMAQRLTDDCVFQWVKRGTNNRSKKYVTSSDAEWKGSVFMTKIKSRQIHYILYVQFENFNDTENFNKR